MRNTETVGVKRGVIDDRCIDTFPQCGGQLFPNSSSAVSNRASGGWAPVEGCVSRSALRVGMSMRKGSLCLACEEMASKPDDQSKRKLP